MGKFRMSRLHAPLHSFKFFLLLTKISLFFLRIAYVPHSIQLQINIDAFMLSSLALLIDSALILFNDFYFSILCATNGNYFFHQQIFFMESVSMEQR